MNIALYWESYENGNYKSGCFLICRSLMVNCNKYIYVLRYSGNSGCVVSFDIDYLFKYAEAVNQFQISWMDHFYP